MGGGASKSKNAEPLPPIRLIDFDHFKRRGEFPRFPEDEDMAVDIAKVDVDNALIVFISHCWLRGWAGAEGFDGRPHPDNSSHEKYALCVDGITQLKANCASILPYCYIWLDFGCINQNGNPAGELKQLDKIVQSSDCIFTPIVDKANWEMKMTSAGFFKDYKAAAWNGPKFGYLSRGWCRVEMLYAANIPVDHDKHESFTAGLKLAAEAKRRPHYLYGSKELKDKRAPICLPPLQNSYFEDYHPLKGSLSVATDKEKISELVDQLKGYMKAVESGYAGAKEKGKLHGYGRHVFPSGDVYTGQWAEHKKHGKGKFQWISGDVYEGDWVKDTRTGHGVFTWASGDKYDGHWLDNMKHGQGYYTFASGDYYDGSWVRNQKSGWGKYVYTNGEMFEGEWMNDTKCNGHGRDVYNTGNIYEGEWKDKKRHGKGKFFYKTGEFYDGDWECNRMHGYGKFTWADGRVYEGAWSNNKKHGYGKDYNAAGELLYEGEWTYDKPVGPPIER
mmetsp:Transcript_5845/g.9493  ORF Transcript_5845/g.9493 Transcript_5845/m.9493 type:complete len:502 (+) Transcript_5845:129-1634(+)